MVAIDVHAGKILTFVEVETYPVQNGFQFPLTGHPYIEAKVFYK